VQKERERERERERSWNPTIQLFLKEFHENKNNNLKQYS
jgi:hypothetical protein